VCLGRTHALSGLAAGAAASTLYLHLDPPHAAFCAALTAGFATLPDLDSCGSTASRSLGFLSEGFAWVVRTVSGGHRHATHSALGVGIFTVLAWAACHYRHTWAGLGGLLLLLTLGIAAGLRALGLLRHLDDIAAIVAASAIVGTQYGLTLMPLACGLGVAVHIVGDMCTDEGVPLAWPLSQAHFRLLPGPLAFTTGTRPETWVVAPGLMVALGWLCWHAAAVPGWLRL